LTNDIEPEVIRWSLIDSVVANRHQIAHGRFVGLTLGRMKQYYDEIIKAIALVDEQCVNK